MFKFIKVQKINFLTYLLEDSCGKCVAGKFYKYELHCVANPDVYLVAQKGKWDLCEMAGIW